MPKWCTRRASNVWISNLIDLFVGNKHINFGLEENKMKKYLKKAVSIILALSVIFVMAACASETSTVQPTAATATGGTPDTASPEVPGTVKIGIILPFTGSNARIGQLQYNGMELFINNFNKAGGFASMNGATVEIVKADTTGAPEVGVTELERVITQKNVSAVLGPYNSAVGAATAPIAEKYKTPYILSNCTADEILYTPYKYVYRVNHSNTNDASDLVSFLKYLRDNKENASFTKFAVVYENTDWGKGMNKALAQYLTEGYGGEVVVSEAYQANAADFSSIISKIKASGAEVTIPVAYLADALLFTQQMAEYKCDSIILASSGGFTVPDFVQKVGPAGEYVLTAASWDLSVLPFKSEEATKLSEQYKEIYSEAMDGYAVNGYLAAAALVGAIDRAGSDDRDAINEALAATNVGSDDPALMFHPYSGISFEKEIRGMTHQNIYASGIILQVINGEFKLVGPSSLTGDDTELVWPIPKYSER